MTGERLSATWGGVAKRGSNGRTAAFVGTLLTYLCAGFVVYVVLSAIL